MAEITNRLGLPEVLVRALARDPYSRGAADFSVTQLIDAPRIRVLRERHANQITRDISDSIWLLLGKAVHHILEHGAATTGAVVEERLFVRVGGHTVSGQMDVQHSTDGCEIIDWKVTTVATVSSEERIKKWEHQLNCYAALRVLAREQAGELDIQPRLDVRRLTIVAFLRDWSKGRAGNDGYPPAPVVPIDIPLWSVSDQLSFLGARVAEHVFAEMDLPDCTDEDRWKRFGGYELVQITKDGREWVREKFSGSEALQSATQKMKENIAASKRPIETWVREIPAVPVRCMEWCEVAPFCSQWQTEREGTGPSLSIPQPLPTGEESPAKAEEK